MLMVLSTLFLVGVAGAQVEQRPAELPEDATWPTPAQWEAGRVQGESPHLVRVIVARGPDANATAFARAMPGRAAMDLVLFGPESEAVSTALGCTRERCRLRRSDPSVSILEEGLGEPDAATLDAATYARVLVNFEGGLYDNVQGASSVGPHRLGDVAEETSLEWAQSVAESPQNAPTGARMHAAGILTEHGDHAAALALASSFRPRGYCSMDTYPQTHAREVSVLAAKAGRTGLALNGLLSSVDYWRTPRSAWSSYGYAIADVTGWTDDLPGVDHGLLVEGLVVDLRSHDPMVGQSVVRALATTPAIRQHLRQRVSERAGDPWNQLVLLAALEPTVRRRSDGSVRVRWSEAPRDDVVLDPLVALALAALTGV